MGRHNDRNIKDVLSAYIINNNKVFQGYHTVNIEKIWKEQMGPVISGYTEKVSFSNGILKIHMNSSPLKKELLLGKDKLIQLLNEAVGQAIIQNVEIY